MHPLRHDDTIAAAATPPGRGALAVVRVSGPAAGPLIRKLFRPDGRRRLVPNRAVLGRLIDPSDGSIIDQAVVTAYRAPRSYTGQDMAEISVHGSPVIVRELLRLLLHSGARLAEPGEFTLRAFLAGKLDLTQAEAVRDVVAARTLHQARVAERQLAGSVSRSLQPVKDELIAIICALETELEFGEDMPGEHPAHGLAGRLSAVSNQLAAITAGFRYGRLLQDGFSLAITGGANVGKSSLFNRLLGEERAIVTELPGTTRDVLREPIQIEGLPVTVIDTAGLRASDDRIERLGIEKSAAAVADADVIVFVIDASRDWESADDERLAAVRSHGVLLALNKSDLPIQANPSRIQSARPATPMVLISARTGAGLDELRRQIRILAAPDDALPADDAVIVGLRQQACVSECLQALESAAVSLAAGESEEFLLYHLRRALASLDTLTGATAVEDLLGRIFSTFCIGK